MVITQDAAGVYKLSGVDVLYTFVTRADIILTVTDGYGLGITQAVGSIPAAAPFTSQAMQLTASELLNLGINLNITLNEDMSGSIAEGSYYPDVNTITDENGNCITLQQVLPVTDNFTYTSNSAAGLSTGGYNVLGLPGISTQSGLGGFGLSGSVTFENYPIVPEHPTLCGPDGSCFDFTVGDIDGSGTLEVYPDTNLSGIPEYLPGGTPLTGITGGFFKKRGLNTDDLESVFPGNTAPDFYLEWHGVDGIDSGLGWGDDEDVDEDGDGTWFDREIGIPGITSTYLNPEPECGGITQPIFGDVSAVFHSECIDTVGVAASGHIMDTGGDLAAWGNYLTYHAAMVLGCETAGLEAAAAGVCLDQFDAPDALNTAVLLCAGLGVYAATLSACMDAGGCLNYCLQAAEDVETAVGCNGLPVGATCWDNDDTNDGDLCDCKDTESCMDALTITGNSSILCNEFGEVAAGCYNNSCSEFINSNYPEFWADDSDHDFDGSNGRLTMNFDMPCIPIIEAREVIAEFVQVGVGTTCTDTTACGTASAGSGWACYYGYHDSSGYEYCYLSGTCEYSCELDCQDLGCGCGEAGPSGCDNVCGSILELDCNGYCGGDAVEDCNGVCNSDAVLTDCGCGETASDGATGCCADGLGPNNETPDCAGVCGGDDISCLSIDKLSTPDRYSITSLYPNPFNPVLNISYGLPENANIQVVVYDIGGEHIETLFNGFKTAGDYSINWDASVYPSGLYLIRLVGSDFSETHKAVLTK